MVFIPESDRARAIRLQTEENNAHEDRFAASSHRVAQAEQARIERLRPIEEAGAIARRAYANRLNTPTFQPVIERADYGGKSKRKSKRNKRNKRKSRKI